MGCGGAELNIVSGSTSKIVVPINLGNPWKGCKHLKKHLADVGLQNDFAWHLSLGYSGAAMVQESVHLFLLDVSPI